MGKGVSECADLLPFAEKLFEDRQWHCMSEVVRVVGPHIAPERATWFFQAMRPEKTPGKCDTMQKVREGKRRGIYLTLRRLMERGMVECRETTDPSLQKKPDNREYRLIMSSDELAKLKEEQKAKKMAEKMASKEAKKPEHDEDQKPKPKRQRKRTPMSTTIAQPDPTRYPKEALNSAMAFLDDVDAMRDMFSEQFPNSEDKDDLEFHLRHVKRIISINFLSKPKMMEPETPPQTPPATPEIKPEITTAIVKG